MRRAFGALASALVGVAGMGVAAPAAHATTPYECTSDGGVWVVVHGVRSGCAKNPSTGVDALRQIGVKIQVANNGIICGMNGSHAESCNKFDGKNYWIYYHAAPGGMWEYSKRGAQTYRPQPGSVEGWVFGQTDVTYPRMPAFTKPTPTATVKATSAKTTAPAPRATTSATPTAKEKATAKPTASATRTATPSARPSRPAAQATATATPDVTQPIPPTVPTTAAATPTLESTPATATAEPTAPQNSGSPVGLIATLATAVVGGLLAAWWATKGRRR